MSVSESAGVVSFTVSLTALSAFDTEVSFTTIDGTATAGSDYVLNSGVLTIPAGTLTDTCVPGPPDAEICDGIDNDCDGVTDEDDANGALTWYRDADSDGFGNSDDSFVSCGGALGYVEFDGDCDDADPETYPGATEMCNDTDND